MSAHKPESNKACAVRMGAHGFFEVRQVTRMESARDRPLHATRPAAAVKALARVHINFSWIARSHLGAAVESLAMRSYPEDLDGLPCILKADVTAREPTAAEIHGT
jgi:hypothetical protein